MSAIRADRVRRVDAVSPTLYPSPNAVFAPTSRRVERVTAKTRFGDGYRVEGSKSRPARLADPGSLRLVEPSSTVTGRYNVTTDSRRTVIDRFRPVVGGRRMPTGMCRHAPGQITGCLSVGSMMPVGVSGVTEGRARAGGGTPPRPLAAEPNAGAPPANGGGMSRNGDGRAPPAFVRSGGGGGRSHDPGGSRRTPEGTRLARGGRVGDGGGRAPRRGGRPWHGRGAASDAGGKVVNGRRPVAAPRAVCSGPDDGTSARAGGAEPNGGGRHAHRGSVAE